MDDLEVKININTLRIGTEDAELEATCEVSFAPTVLFDTPKGSMRGFRVSSVRISQCTVWYLDGTGGYLREDSNFQPDDELRRRILDSAERKAME